MLACLPQATHADDFGLRTDIGLTKKLGSSFSVDADLGYRMQDNWKAVDRWSAGVGINYKPFRFLKLGASYTYIYAYKTAEWKKNYNKRGEWRGYNADHAFWRSKNRFSLSATGSVEAGRFTFSLREMLQITRLLSITTTEDKYRFSDMENHTGLELQASERDDKSARTRQYLRSRLGVEYNIRHCPLTPYASFELSNDLSDGFSVAKRRLSVGTDYKISKKHRLSVGYVYDNGADDDNDDDMHCIEIGYKFKF